jgi:hypothetical protein
MFGILTGIGAGLGLLGGIGRRARAARREREIRNRIAAYQRQDLDNAFDDLSVSRLGADLLAQENARTSSSAIDALQRGGIRGVVGGVGSVVQRGNLLNQQAAADLDRQRTNINQMRAQDDVRIRAMQERREEQDLAGLGNELNNARQDKANAYGDMVGSLMSLGTLGQGGAFAGLGGLFGGGQKQQNFLPYQMPSASTYNLGGMGTFPQ